jgi:transcription termination factor NusB
MQKVAITINGIRYEFEVDETLAKFIIEDLTSADIALNQDNKTDKLLKAYLRLAKQISEHENQINNIISKIDNIDK